MGSRVIVGGSRLSSLQLHLKDRCGDAPQLNGLHRVMEGLQGPRRQAIRQAFCRGHRESAPQSHVLHAV